MGNAVECKACCSEKEQEVDPQQKSSASSYIVKSEEKAGTSSPSPIVADELDEGLASNDNTAKRRLFDDMNDEHRPVAYDEAQNRVMFKDASRESSDKPQVPPIWDKQAFTNGKDNPEQKDTTEQGGKKLTPRTGSPRDLNMTDSSRTAETQPKDSSRTAMSSPRGDYITTESQNIAIQASELALLEKHVAMLAGSPLGCIDFGNTFRNRQTENQIVVLRGHSLAGMAFGDVCNKYRSRRVTILGLRNESKKAFWAPAPYIKVHASDDILLIQTTPFALAMGLNKEASLAQYTCSLSPRTHAQGVPLTPGSGRKGSALPGRPIPAITVTPDSKNRRCCG